MADNRKLSLKDLKDLAKKGIDSFDMDSAKEMAVKAGGAISEKAAETFEDKIFHLIQNESLESGRKCAILIPPQMSRQSERSQA